MKTLETAHENNLHEDDCILLTEAGMKALRVAAEGENEALEQETLPFVPDTKEKIDWVLSKIADARARAARIREHGEAMAKQADRDADALEWKFGPALQDFARRELTGKKKSLTLYHGVIGFRTKPAGVTVTNEGLAVEWAKEHCPVAVVERLDKAALVDTLKASGEVVPFAEFRPAEEVFYIR